jgi:biotin operon repressor
MQSFSFELKISEIEREKTMKISRKEFSVLDALQDTDEALSQRDLQLLTGYSLGTVNKVIKALTENGLAADGRITSKGLEALEPYRVKRAVFIAAGFGSRMVPVTLNTPKPLVRVNGKRIIDGLLDAVIAAGIEDIVIVRGYLAEQFDQLLYKYPMIRFLENPAYNEATTSLRRCVPDICWKMLTCLKLICYSEIRSW